MKKRLFKVFSMLFCAALLFTGCATVSDIPNDSDELIFNGGNAVQVGDYLYFANSYKEVGSASEDYAYDQNAQVAYLNRIGFNENSGITYPLVSPKNNEKVNSMVVGYENQYMFVLGDYIYYTSPNTHKNSSLKNNYNLVSIFRSRLNGDGVQEIVTTDTFDSTKSQFRTLKGYDNNYYLIVFDGTKLMSFALGDRVGGKVVIAENVQSLALPKENDSYEYREIIYTVKKDENAPASSSTIDVYSYDYATAVYNEKNYHKATSLSYDITLVGRSGDTVFYTNNSKEGGYETYYKTLKKGTSLNFSADQIIYNTAKIGNIQAVSYGDPTSEGYVFVGTDSKTIMYKNMTSSSDAVDLVLTADYSDLLFIEGDYIYYSKTTASDSAKTGFYRMSVKNRTEEEVVTLDENSFVSNKVSYAGNYLYFYAKLQTVETDETEYETDDNYYCYRVQKDGQGGYQILSTFTRKVKEDN